MLMVVSEFVLCEHVKQPTKKYKVLGQFIFSFIHFITTLAVIQTFIREGIIIYYGNWLS